MSTMTVSGLTASVIVTMAACLTVLAQNVSAAEGVGTRCDCAIREGTCVARIAHDGKWIKIRSSTPQCSAVQFTLNGDSNYTVVTDYESVEEWLGKNTLRSVSVKTCVVCKDFLKNKGDNRTESDRSGNALKKDWILGRWAVKENARGSYLYFKRDGLFCHAQEGRDGCASPTSFDSLDRWVSVEPRAIRYSHAFMSSVCEVTPLGANEATIRCSQSDHEQQPTDRRALAAVNLDQRRTHWVATFVRIGD